MKKIAGIIAGIVIAVVIILGVTRADTLILPDNLFSDKKSGEKAAEEDKTNKVSTSKGTIDQSQIDNEDFNKVDDKNIYKMQDTVETRGIQYKVQSFYISKEKGDFDPQPGVWQETCAVDENGNITGAYSYVIVNLEAMNVTDQEQSMSFYSCGLDLLDQEGKRKYSSGYIKRPDGEKIVQSEDMKSAYEYVFQPGEKIDQVLAFAVEDSLLADSKIDFFIWPEGMQGYHTESRIIQMYE